MNAAQITIVCLFKAKENTKQLVREELLHLADLTRKEDGCINYDLHVSNTDDGLFILHENWRDKAALDNHMNQPHVKAWRSKAEELLEQPADIKICTKL